MAADFEGACMGITETKVPNQSGTPASEARVKFIALWSLLLLAKAVLAASMPLFGDEAFYAWEAVHPAWAYSDLPGGTAAAIALGTTLAGDTGFGVRLLFLLAGAAWPWLVVRTAWRFSPGAPAWRAGLWSLPLPLLVPTGFMALPDALLVLATLLALDACVGLLRVSGSLRGLLHLELAIGLVLGALAHYRFAPLLFAGGLAFVAAGGWRCRREPGLWLAMAAGALAWLPVVVYNLEAQGAGVQFQLLERHPWAFDAKGLAQPLLQALATTPLLYGLMAWALLVSRRSPDAMQRFLAWAGLGLWVFYAVLAPFVDKARFSLHWPLPAYLVAAILLPKALEATRTVGVRRLAPWAAGLAAIGSLLMLAVVAVPAAPGLAARTAGTALYPDNFVGWREIGDAVSPRLAPGEVLVADHFMLAAQLAFQLDRRAEVYVLDHWNNHKHGRAAQLAGWGYDEAGLAQVPAGTTAWIVFEVEETPPEARAAWVRRACRWFVGLEHVATVPGPGGGKHFWIFRGRRAVDAAAAACAPALPQG